jgi:hypothetical protein
MRRLKHSVASDVVPLPPYIFLHVAQKLAVRDAHVRQEGDQVVGGVCSVWTAVVQTGGGERFCEEFLAAEGRVAAAALVGVAADVAVAVTDVVKVFGFELFCGAVVLVKFLSCCSDVFRGLTISYQLEGFPPEDNALLHVQANAF